MEVTVRGKHVTVSEQVAERAQQKFAHLDHYLPLLKDAVVEVDVAHERTKEPDGRYVVHVSVNGNGIHLRAEGHAARPETAIDSAARVLTEQARRHKERLYGRARHDASRDGAKEEAQLESEADDDEDEDSELLAKVTRVKRFSVKPMSIEEAVEEMELLGHNFYLFLDADEEQFALLYRRNAGDLGLIIPERS